MWGALKGVFPLWWTCALSCLSLKLSAVSTCPSASTFGFGLSAFVVAEALCTVSATGRWGTTVLLLSAVNRYMCYTGNVVKCVGVVFPSPQSRKHYYATVILLWRIRARADVEANTLYLWKYCKCWFSLCRGRSEGKHALGQLMHCSSTHQPMWCGRYQLMCLRHD